MNIDWNIVQQSVLTAAPVGALVFAWLGLDAWKRQLRGTYDFELSRRTLMALYKFRESLRVARNPFIQPVEADKGRDDWETSAYENRWKAVGEARSELNVATIEAEASWGESLKPEFQELHKLAVSLMLATRHYLSSARKGSNPRLFSEKDKEVLWGDEGDEYDRKLSAAIKAFEDKVRPRLGRK